MNIERYDELEQRATGELEKMFPEVTQKLSAKQKIANELAAMVKEDKVLILTHDEEGMIRAYRRWRARQTKNGSTFRWQISFSEAEVEVVQETGFVVDPRE